MSCILCAGKNIRKIFIKDGREFYRCDLCDLIFISPWSSKGEELKNLYGRDYYKPWQIGEDGYNAIKKNKVATFNRWLEKIERHHRPSRILDVGCAMGFFLEIAQDRGWDPYGIELSSYSFNIAQHRFGSRVKNSSLEDSHFDPESFDAVAMFDVIEHSTSPLEELRKAHAILKDDGLIAISTINIDSLSCRLLGSNWPHFKSEHLCYFSPFSITTALEKAGFRTIWVGNAKKFLSLAYIRSYFDVYKFPALGRISNLLYSILPKSISNIPFSIPSGEMFVIASKE